MNPARAFTLIELLIVIAIIGIIAAILFPVFAKVREKARQTTCLSNERQLAMGIEQYVDDYDDMFPWSWSWTSQNMPWGSNVDPYVKSFSQPDGAYDCPDSGTAAMAFSTNSQIIGLLQTNQTPPNDGFYVSVLALPQIVDPASIVLLGDGLVLPAPPGDVRPVTGPRSSDEFTYPHPADVADHTNDPTSENLQSGDFDKQISWRHTGGANFAFCDGHAKYYKLGGLTDANWDVRCAYGQICQGATGSSPSDYPAPDGSCGTQSPIDCQ